MKKLILLIFLLMLAVSVNAQKTKRTQEQLYAEATQGRADGKDFVFRIKGSAYAFIPGERPQKVFNVDGFNIRRRIETPEKDGYFLATREIVFYQDPKTNEILSEWTNPWTKEKVEVFHIQNDPVNGRYRYKDGKTIGVSVDGTREFGESAPPEDVGDFWVYTSDVFPFYPLPGFEKNYTASEMFDFYVPKSDLNTTTPPKTMISWTRVGPWLPWMKMPNNGGVIIMHARSWRYEKFEDLPAFLTKEIKTKYPTYAEAPRTVDPKKPNETSWTFYNRIMAERAKKN